MSLSRIRLALAFLLLMGPLVGNLPVGSAQTPGGGPYFDLQVTSPQDQTIDRDRGSRTFDVAVKVVRAAGKTQVPIEEQFVHEVTLALNPVPANGWTHSADTTELKLQLGETGMFRVTVTIQISDPEGDKYKVDFTVRNQPVWNGTQNEIAKALARNFEASDSESGSFVAKRDLSTAESITSFVRTYLWWLLGAAGVIVGMIVVLKRKKEGAVTAATENPRQDILAGRGASFPIRLTNEGHERESLSLSTSELPEGWSAILPVDRLDLNGRETTTIWLTVRAPAGARPGDHVQMTLLASTGAGVAAEVRLEASVVERYGAPPPPAPQEPAPEEPPVAAPRPRRGRS